MRRIRPSLKDMMRAGLQAQRLYAASVADDDPRRAANQARIDALAATLPPKRHRIRRPVDNKPVHASEHQEQATVIQWWRHQYEAHRLPEFALFAIPNGGARDLIAGARLKAEGVRKGALDLMLAKPNRIYSGLFIEMKVGSNKPTPEQEKFIQYLASAGYRCAVCWSATEAISEIEGYLREAF